MSCSLFEVLLSPGELILPKYQINKNKLTKVKMPIITVSIKLLSVPFIFVTTASIPIVISIRTKKVSIAGVSISQAIFFAKEKHPL